MLTGTIHIAYCHITSITNYQIHVISSIFHKHISGNKVDTEQVHIVYCNQTFIHMCNVYNLIHLEIDVDIGQIHVAYLFTKARYKMYQISHCLLYIYIKYYFSFPKAKWKLGSCKISNISSIPIY